MLLTNKFEVKYNQTPESDVRAINDIKGYITPKAWAFLLEMATDTKYSLQDINIGLDFAGVRGYPFHAFARKYRLEEYRKWCRDGGVFTTPEGFPINLSVVK